MKTRLLAWLCILCMLPALAMAEDYLVGESTLTQTDMAADATFATTEASAEMQQALALLAAGSFLSAVNAFAGISGEPDASRYAEYAYARLLMLRDDPAAALVKWETLSGFLDSDYQRSLCQTLRLHRFAQNAKFGYVDAEGSWRIPPQFDWAERVFRAESVSADTAATPLPVALVFQGQTSVTETDIEPAAGTYGLIRSDGALIVPAVYDSVLWTVSGVAAVSDASGISLFDLTSGALIGHGYEAVGAYAEGYIPVQKDGLWGYLDPQGGTLLGDGFAWDSALPFSEGKATVSKAKQYGYIDTAANLMIPLTYTGAESFSDGLAGIRVKKKWGFIDASGEIVIKPAYAAVKTFQYGLCAVKRGDAWGLLDTTGNLVLRAKYSEIGDFDPIHRRAWVRQNKLWGLASTAGTMVLAPSWGSHDDFNANTLCRVSYRGNYGYIDVNGNMRIFIQYEAAAPFSADYGAVVDENGTVVYLNKNMRSFTIDTDVPVECRQGFIEGRKRRSSQWNYIDEKGEATVIQRWHMTFALFDQSGTPIPVATYSAQASDQADGA